MKRIHVIVLVAMAYAVCGTAFGEASSIQIAGSPVEVVVGSVSQRTVKVEIVPLDAAGKEKPEAATRVLVDFPVTEVVRVRELDGMREVPTKTRMALEIKPNPLTISVWQGGSGADRRLVQEITVDGTDGSMVFHTPGPVFGLGEGRQQFDRRGYYYNFVNGQTTFLATLGATIPVPFLIGMDEGNSGRGWGIFIHNPPPRASNGDPFGDPRQANLPWGTFDLRGPDANGAWAGPPTEARAPSSNNPLNAVIDKPQALPVLGRFVPRKETLGEAPIQIYVMALDQPADAMEEFVRLTGHPVMPPKWVMGYMQSHRSLAPGEPVKIAETFREKNLPCDALIYLGTGYTVGDTGWNLGHGSLEFNPKIFDKPKEIIDKLHALNFKIILHKNEAPPGLYGESVNEKSADPIHISNYWQTHVPLVKMGIDGWWPDDGDNLPIEARLARHELYYEGSLKDAPDERPWSLNRNGYAGVSKYGGWIWSGDVQSRWVTLANHVSTGLNFSMSVSPFWGTDTGGFFIAPPSIPAEYTGELYARWFEFSTFTPLFRSHGRNWHLHLPWGWDLGDVGPKEQGTQTTYPPDSELHNTAIEAICKKYLDLRYSLLPYNYTLMREACDTGMPPMRAMVLAFPQDAAAVKLGDQYMWGPSMLVAPVVEKGATKRKMYLPGTQGGWYDWWTGQRRPSPIDINGGVITWSGSWAEPAVDLATMPLFVKAGAIVPVDPVRQWTGQSVTDPTTLRVYPGANGEFVMYDDDGHTEGYQNGTDAKLQWIHFAWNDAQKKLTIERDARMKTWPAGMVRNLKVQVIGGAAKNAEFKGEKIELSF